MLKSSIFNGIHAYYPATLSDTGPTHWEVRGPDPAVTIRELTIFSPWAAQGLGALMPQLDPTFSGRPIDENLLRPIIESKTHAQLVAVQRDAGEVEPTEKIVGAVSLSIVMGAGFGRRGQMEDVIVNANMRGKRVGSMLLRAVEEWHGQHSVSWLAFETEAHRAPAIAMYKAWGAQRVTDGATVSEGIVYRKDFIR